MQNLELAKKRIDDTYLLMQYGRASSRRVLDSQKALFDAQNDAADALVLHTTATLNFWTAVGVLQVRPDGMWENVMAEKTKAPAPAQDNLSLIETPGQAGPISEDLTPDRPPAEDDTQSQSDIMAMLKDISASLAEPTWSEPK
jgi:hypothetical protein